MWVLLNFKINVLNKELEHALSFQFLIEGQASEAR